MRLNIIFLWFASFLHNINHHHYVFHNTGSKSTMEFASSWYLSLRQKLRHFLPFACPVFSFCLPNFQWENFWTNYIGSRKINAWNSCKATNRDFRINGASDQKVTEDRPTLRCNEHRCPLSPQLVAWMILEFPD